MEQVELFEKLPHFRSRKPQLSPMPIIVGAPRSGTTLLRFMLDSHPELAIPPETGFLPILAEQAISGTATAESYYTTITNTPLQSPAWPDFSLDASAFEKSLRSLRPFDPTEATRRFYRQYADRFAKKRCGEKTPMYSVHMPAIETLLPEAAFIHLIRDGRDASLSLRPLWFSPSADISELAEQWKSTVVKARQDSTLVRKYLEIRYEELLTSPTKILSTIGSFLEMPYSSCMEAYYQRTPERLREHLERKNANGTTWLTQEQRISQQWRTTLPPDTSRIGVWRTQMSQEDHALFRNVAGPLLSDLGYE